MADRQCQIAAELNKFGIRMEPSLSSFDGEGHALVRIATGELIDPPNAHVLALAIEWSEIEGVCAD